MEPLPAYVEDRVPQNAFAALLTRISSAPILLLNPDHANAHSILENYVTRQRAPAYRNHSMHVDSRRPIEEYPADPDAHTLAPDTTLICIKQQIVRELFAAIRREDDESVALLIQNNLVTANTTNMFGLTPLLAAIVANVMRIVKQLLDLGADPNKFGVVSGKKESPRTPLMLAASRGSLSIVKLLHEAPYCANDALVAPDGQIALRFAAAGGHAAVIAYLPPRRAGGFLRFKTANASNIARTKKAARAILTFFRVVLWEVPRFLLWSLPKERVVLPAIQAFKWCWAHRSNFPRWCRYQLVELPRKLERAGNAVVRAVENAPAFVAKIGKGIWRTGKWIWTLCTVRIPRATAIALPWIWSGFRTLGITAWNIITLTVSFMHTVFLAAVTFFRGLTLRDIWHVLYDILHIIFVALPAAYSSWTWNFRRVSHRIMRALFGKFGEDLWEIAMILGELVIFYVPMKIWFMIKSVGSALAIASHEVMVWIIPKA